MIKIKFIFLIIILELLHTASSAQTVRVGSKHFTEGYILSEIIAQLLEHNGVPVERKFNLGGTMVCFTALKENEIDIYPEYSGTIAAEILHVTAPSSLEQLRTELFDSLQLIASEPYGFNNTYALIITSDLAAKLNLNMISDLRQHPDLRIGLSYEFLKRRDGWDNLAQTYSLSHKNVFGLEHGLAYAALQEGKMEVTDAYSTDGEISKYKLKVLEDDKKYFPMYEALSLHRKGLPMKAVEAIEVLDNGISEEEIRSMNGQVLFQNKSYTEVAREFIMKKGWAKVNSPTTFINDSVLMKIGEHVGLTSIALLLSILVALPLGILTYWKKQWSQLVLYTAGLLQTIPSIALLAMLIPLTGIGVLPAVVALFLYALLPILRSTVTGLATVDPSVKILADGLGMTRWQKLRFVEFPLAVPSILSGIRTAAVINIGTATLAAFIGAGGLGEFVVTGLALNNYDLILRGAIPAAILAIITELLFEIIDRFLLPPHLRNRSKNLAV